MSNGRSSSRSLKKSRILRIIQYHLSLSAAAAAQVKVVPEIKEEPEDMSAVEAAAQTQAGFHPSQTTKKHSPANMAGNC